MNELVEISKKLSGDVLVIGYSEKSKLYNNIGKNNQIRNIIHLYNDDDKKNKKTYKHNFLKNKKISIKKMYKDLKKQKFDYVIVDFAVIKKYLNSFIYNSYKLCNKKIYILINDDIFDYNEVKYRYSRYKANVICDGKKNEYLLDIDVSKMSINIPSRLVYLLRDTLYSFIELIFNIIIS